VIGSAGSKAPRQRRPRTAKLYPMPKFILALTALLWLSSAQGQPAYTISTIAGTSKAGFAGDGGQAVAAELNNPYLASLDSAGNVYIADFDNNRIRKVTTAEIISTFAGTDVAGFGGDNGPAASANLYKPSSVFFDTSGNLFIADQFNNRVRKITPGGIVTTVAGSNVQGYCGDGGQATSACLNGPIDAVTDTSGNLYIAEFGSNAIRKVNTSGIISTIAGGNANGGYSGDGGPATAAALRGPTGVAVDATGDVFIADGGNERIRKITAGIIATVAGTGTAGYSGDGGAATTAQLSFPGACDWMPLVTYTSLTDTITVSDSFPPPAERYGPSQEMAFLAIPAMGDQRRAGKSTLQEFRSLPLEVSTLRP
jgi:hypothetical protein